MDRIRIGIQSVAGSAGQDQVIDAVTLRNIAAQEILAVRGFFLQSLAVFEGMGKRAAAASSSTSSSSSGGGWGGGGLGGTTEMRRLAPPPYACCNTDERDVTDQQKQQQHYLSCVLYHSIRQPASP